MHIVVNGLLTQYDMRGKGKVVLLLHGWGDSAQTWHKLLPALASKYQVVVLDLPGFGATQPPQDVWNLDNYADFLHAFVDKLELKQPYAVIGHSNGGALALRTIALGKLQPTKLILLAASGIRSTNKAKRLFLNILAKTGNVATLWMPERYRAGLRKSLYGAAGSDLLVVPGLQETFKKTVRQDTQADAKAIQTDTLLVYAEGDNDVPVSDGKRYHALIQNSKLEIIPSAGHFVHHDASEQVAQLVKDFLNA